MVCYSPLQAWRARAVNESGARPIVFHRRDGYDDLEVKLACGRCVGCRLERSRQWAVRAMHEAKMHERNCYLTLTYSDDCLPLHGTLVLKHWQDFMKRLKSHVRRKTGRAAAMGIRFIMCGEYGEKTKRPHYHACVFGYDFADKVFFQTTRDGHALYTSETLASVWGHGHCTIGDVTFESAAYVARYVMKKVIGEDIHGRYEYVDEDGVVHPISPELFTQSRRPGIGARFVATYLSDIYPNDFVIVNGKKARPPRFYDSFFEAVSSDDFRVVKTIRSCNGRDHSANNTPDRLKVREEVQLRKLERFKREIE